MKITHENENLDRKKSINKKFLSKSLFLILQGQFISDIGDTIYLIALGFWVLAFTGSPAMMGILMATSLIPGVLLSPFAGVVVDRTNRKKLMIITDFIMGITVILVAVTALTGILQLWMVFLAGILLGIGGAFFGPAVMSVLPQMVSKDKLTNVNSLFGIANTGADILGNGIGGVLYVLLGAPLMFLINGLSFLISGVSIIFAKIPKSRESKITKENFILDLKDSFKFVWKLKGLLYMLIILGILSFLSYIAIVLLIPLFQFTPGLGVAKYGIAMASFTAGVFLGLVILSALKIQPHNRAAFMLISLSISNLSLVIFALTSNFYLMVALLFISGITGSVANVFILASIQSVVSDDMMGKVMGLVSTVIATLIPLGMITGGLLAEIFPIKTIFLVSFLFSFLGFVILFLIPSVRKFINFDPGRQDMMDLF